MIIRDMFSSEEPLIIEIIQDAFQAPPWNLVMPMSEIEPRLQMFADNHRQTLVAEFKEEPVGLIWFGVVGTGKVPLEITNFLNQTIPDAVHIYIGAVAVRTSHQGLGISKALMERAIETINSTYPVCAKYSRIRSDNLRAIAVHKDYGFRRSKIHEDNYGVRDEWWFCPN